LYHPAVVFVIFIGSYYGLYFTPLFEAMMRFHWAHQLMNLHFLVTGYAYYSLIIGVDRPPRPLPQIGKLDRKSTRLNSSHVSISYAVFCLKKKNIPLHA